MRIRDLLGLLILAGLSCVMAQERVPLSELVPIPSGAYIPLYTKDKTARNMKAFQVEVGPVSRAQYLAFVRDQPRWRRSRVKPLFADRSYLKDWDADLDHGSDPDAPVTFVSWFAARAYARYAGRRLLTTDEWEYIGRADATRTNATSDAAFNQVILDWYAARPPNPLPPATNFPANVYGVRALHGLVWEWTDDFNNAMVTGESRGDTGLERKLFCAGGALGAADVQNYAAFMRYAYRSALKGHYTTSLLGFRCAADPTPDEEKDKP